MIEKRKEEKRREYSISNFYIYIFQTEMEGLTGLIKFDTSGFRTNFQLDVVRVTEKGLKKIGIWKSTNASKWSVEWLLESQPPKFDAELSLQNKTFIILIAIVRRTERRGKIRKKEKKSLVNPHDALPLQSHPYGMLKKSADTMTGNDRYEGFGIDVIQELSKMLGFNYTFEVQADNVYGSYSKKTKKWTGMLGKIIAGVSIYHRKE